MGENAKEGPNSTVAERRWLDLTVRIALSLGLLYCIYLVSTRAIALWYFRHRPAPEGILIAIEWDPANPQYYSSLGVFYERSLDQGNLDQAIRYYEKATELSPNRWRYWLNLAGAYELVGRLEEAERAYKRARELFPNSPRVNWQLANFLLRAGRIEEALPALEKTVIGDPEMRQPAFDLAWRAGADPTLILEKMIPAEIGIYFEYLGYLVQTKRLDEAAPVWDRLLGLGVPFEPQVVFPYIDALIQTRRLDELVAAWAEIAKRDPIRIRQRAYDPNSITNGDLESEILNGGLDWRITPVEGVVVRVDSLTFFDGTHSLQVSFDGKHNLDYGHIVQYVLVKPNTLYRFIGYMRAQGITTDSGPRFQIYDAYDTAKLFLETDNVVGSSSWSPQQLEFQTGPDTRLLVVRVARPPSRKFDNQIAGTVWIDRVGLNGVE